MSKAAVSPGERGREKRGREVERREEESETEREDEKRLEMTKNTEQTQQTAQKHSDRPGGTICEGGLTVSSSQSG
jgi:hypothetical protein